MDLFIEYLAKVDNDDHQTIMKIIFTWISKTYPELVPVIKWNQPMFTHNGTLIIGFSLSKKHFSIAPETKTIERFEDGIAAVGYSYTKNIIRIEWRQTINYDLLKKLIDFNIVDKAGYKKFFR